MFSPLLSAETARNIGVSGLLIIIILSVVILAALCFFLIYFLFFRKRNIFRKRLKAVINDHELIKDLFSDSYDEKQLYKYSSLIKKIDWDNNTNLYSRLGMDAIWKKQIEQRDDVRSLRYVLQFCIGDALFSAFLLALKNPNAARSFQKWLAEIGIKRGFLEIAYACKGEEFSGKKAWHFFHEQIDSLRDLAGRPEKEIRYMVIKVLINDDHDLSRRILWESFKDSYYRIRETLAVEFTGQDRERLYNELFKLYIHDPVRMVRMAARGRITRDFPDLYTINIANLNDFERLHALEHLDLNSKADENLAIEFLESDKLEERFTAAVYLDECGALKRMFNQADLGDKTDLERKLRLLKSAGDVKVTHYLEDAVKTKNTGTLYLAVKILSETGSRDYINPVVRNIFTLPLDNPDNIELFKEALDCIYLRGNSESHDILNSLLTGYREKPEYLRMILDKMPDHGAFVFKDTLLKFLKDSDFPCPDQLREAVLKNPPYMFMEELFEILHHPSEYPLKVKQEALKILARFEEPALIQNLLENLFILDREDALELTSLMNSLSTEHFDEVLNRLLSSRDLSVRQSLLLILPVINREIYFKYIREALEDSEPEVRKAAVTALVKFGKLDKMKYAFPLLHDPLEDVREYTARILAETGQKAVLSELGKLLGDDLEINSVKIAAIKGLADCRFCESIEILSPLLERESELENYIIKALAGKRSPEEIEKLVSLFKGGVPHLKEMMTEVFVKMGEKAEESLLAMIRDGNRAMVPYIREILERTGFIQALAARLNHRKAEKRKETVEKLLLIGTKEAVRVLIPAARDINKSIRIMTLDGIRKMQSPEGKTLLEDLKANAPDKDVRKHAAWALNRIK